MELRPFKPPDYDTLAPWFDDELAGRWMKGHEWLRSAANAARSKPEVYSLFVGCRDGEPVSVCSFSQQRDPELRAAVSLLVAPDRRGIGAGPATLEALRHSFPEVAEFIGYVDPENKPSLRVLKGFGFVRAGIDDKTGQELLVWRRDGSSPAADWKAPAFVRWWH